MQQPDLKRVRIISAERLNCSVNGNPRFVLTVERTVEGGTREIPTQSDAACNYEVTNYLRGPQLVDLWLTRSGRVSYIARSAQ